MHTVAVVLSRVVTWQTPFSSTSNSPKLFTLIVSLNSLSEEKGIVRRSNIIFIIDMVNRLILEALESMPHNEAGKGYQDPAES